MAFGSIVTQDVIDLVMPLGLNINKGELLVVPIVLWTFPEQLAGQDVLWWVDNMAALGCLIKSSSPNEDMARIALSSHLAMAQLQLRTWFEWVDSDSNPSDPLTRLGFEDPFVKKARWSRVRPIQPPWHKLMRSS